MQQMKDMLAHTMQQRDADARAHEAQLQHMRDEANQQHHEAMQKQQIFMQQQMDERIAAMTAQFQNMMTAAAAGATGQHQPPPHSPSNDAWMDAVDISDQPVPDRAGSSWIGLCDASFVD